MPAESVIERLRKISATFDEDRPAMYGPTVVDVFARNKRGDALYFDSEETALIINALPLLLAVAEKAEKAASILDKGFNVLPDYKVGLELVEAVRALRAGGSDV